jgi:hypothetical protein
MNWWLGHAFAQNVPINKFDADGRLCWCLSLKWWRRDGAPILVWSTMDIGEEVERRNRIPGGSGDVRHCVAACLIKRHFGSLFGVSMRELWDAYHEDPMNDDSLYDVHAENIGSDFACSADETCESACVRHFRQYPRPQ